MILVEIGIIQLIDNFNCATLSFQTVLVCSFLRQGVEATAAPWVATRNSFGSHPKSFEKTVFYNGLFGIFGTSRLKTTGIWQKWRN